MGPAGLVGSLGAVAERVPMVGQGMQPPAGGREVA